MTTATEATLFGNNAPLFVGLGTWLVFRRRPTRAFWTGSALATIGGAAVMIAGMSREVGAVNTAGDFLALTASIFFAAYLLTTEHVRGGAGHTRVQHAADCRQCGDTAHRLSGD